MTSWGYTLSSEEHDPSTLVQLARRGEIELTGRRVVCVLTGSGLKDPDRALAVAPAVQPIPASVGAVEESLGWT